jgi:hypothetical protein
MKVEVLRVQSFELRNLLGFDAPQSVLDAHRDCITRSTAIWLGLADGVEACAIGVIPLTIFSEKAYLWMIHTRLCEAHPLRFVRWSKRVLDEVLAAYPNLYGLCHPDNLSGRAWLEWLGARFSGVHNGHHTFEIKQWPIR